MTTPPPLSKGLATTDVDAKAWEAAVKIESETLPVVESWKMLYVKQKYQKLCKYIAGNVNDDKQLLT